MKASYLIKMLQSRIDTYGDIDVLLYEQTGPDSWITSDVKDVGVYEDARGGKRPPYIIIESKP